MEKKMNNKGFSLVELIIVVAIMAVLIGVLAPAYLQYVEKSKKTSDCTAVGSVLDAIEIIAADPAIAWGNETLNVTLSSGANASYTNGTTAALTQLKSIVPEADAKLTGNWGASITIAASKGTNGLVTFTLGGVAKTDIEKISPALSNRFE